MHHYPTLLRKNYLETGGGGLADAVDDFEPFCGPTGPPSDEEIMSKLQPEQFL